MPELDNDSLEQFFRKAAAKADVSFNEEDWAEMERRLDAVATVSKKKTGRRTAVTVGAGLLLSAVLWLVFEPNSRSDGAELAASTELKTGALVPERPEAPDLSYAVPPVEGSSSTTIRETIGEPKKRVEKNAAGNGAGVQRNYQSGKDERNPTLTKETSEVSPVEDTDTIDESSRTLPDDPERNKQKVVVELPGAEEEETREARPIVDEEHASEKKKHVTAPRLSLLLSLAPDFSGVSMGLLSPPGNAFGAVIHYHPFSRWSISTGAIRNYKVYSASGEEYSPPSGYWKYYTNGVIPETIDGSCSILEFPLMVQYTAIETRNGRVNLAIGTSSYLMRSEAYRYNFAQPNPGSPEGWDSRGSSRFLFNMVNMSVGYERQIVPGLMLGIEPYVKIPLEKIGWSNIKLFSSGAAFTLRYTLVQRKNIPIAVPSRPPS